MYWCNVSCNHFTNQSMFAFQNSQSAWLSHYNYNRITDYRMRRSTSRGDRGVGSRGLWCGRENETYTIRHHYGCQGKLFVCMIRGFHQEFEGWAGFRRFNPRPCVLKENVSVDAYFSIKNALWFSGLPN